MTSQLRKISEGKEGIIFSSDDGSILKMYRVSLIPQDKMNTNFAKVFYGFDSLDALLQNRFELLETARKRGLKVPEPLSVEIMTVEESYDKCGKHEEYVAAINAISNKNPSLAKKLQTHLTYSLRKQFIEGKPLDKNFLPSLKLKHLVQETYKEFYNQGIIIRDERPSNYVLTENDELYMIDEGSVMMKENIPFDVKSRTFGFHTYYSDKILLGYYLLDGLISIKLQQKIIKKETGTKPTIVKRKEIYM